MSEKMKDYISAFHETGIFYPSKTLEVFGDIDESMKEYVIKNLHALDRIPSEDDITLLLSSNGGCVEAGLAIYDAIRAMKNQVRIIGYGGVSSMATVIFQAADKGKRFLTPNSYLMLHEGDGSISGRGRDRKEWNRLVEHQEETCLNIYLKQIKKKKKRYSKPKLIDMLQNDKIFLPKEAVAFGLADDIIEVY